MTKKVLSAIAVIAVLYGGIYVYQRYQRRKANERKASLKEAEDIIKNL
jgi:hypothetical protein